MRNRISCVVKYVTMPSSRPTIPLEEGFVTPGLYSGWSWCLVLIIDIHINIGTITYIQ